MPPRRRPLVVPGLVVAVLVLAATGAGAVPNDRPSTTTSTTTPGDRPATTTTVPTGIDVGQGGDHAGADPDVDLDVEVEPADPETANQVLSVDLAQAEEERDALAADLAALRARVDRLEADLEAYATLTDDLLAEQRRLAEAVLEGRRQLAERAVGAYVQGNTPEIEAAYGATDPNDVEERDAIVGTILEADRDALDALLAERLDVTARLSRVVEAAARAEAERSVVEEQVERARTRLRTARTTVRVLEEGSNLVITGFVFPVADPHTFASTFGAPRSGGRSHEGNDIFAPMGTPLLATENGVIANMGTGILGGIKLWLVGESGTEYYYAHLIAYAEGITDGTRVEAGDVIGYVGNTGNAITTPPHLHFEIHPDGGEAIDPYPLLHAVDSIDGETVLPPLRGYDTTP